MRELFVIFYILCVCVIIIMCEDEADMEDKRSLELTEHQKQFEETIKKLPWLKRSLCDGVAKDVDSVDIFGFNLVFSDPPCD